MRSDNGTTYLDYGYACSDSTKTVCNSYAQRAEQIGQDPHPQPGHSSSEHKESTGSNVSATAGETVSSLPAAKSNDKNDKCQRCGAYKILQQCTGCSDPIFQCPHCCNEEEKLCLTCKVVSNTKKKYDEQIRKAQMKQIKDAAMIRELQKKLEASTKTVLQRHTPLLPFMFSNNQTLLLLLQEKDKSKPKAGQKQTSNSSNTKKQKVDTSKDKSTPTPPDNDPDEESEEDVSDGEGTNQEPTSSDDSYSSGDSFLDKDDKARGGYSEEDWEPSGGSAQDAEEDSSSDSEDDGDEDEDDNDAPIFSDDEELKGEIEYFYCVTAQFYQKYGGYISDEGNTELAVSNTLCMH